MRVVVALLWSAVVLVGSGSALRAEPPDGVRIEVHQPADPPTVEAADSTPAAAALPHEMTICRSERRCWSEAGRSACANAEEQAAPFRTLPVDASDRLPRALQECWQSIGGR